MFDKQELKIIISVFEQKLQRVSRSLKDCNNLLSTDGVSFQVYDEASFNRTKYEHQVRCYSDLLKNAYFMYDEMENNVSEEEGCKNGK